MQLTPTVDLRPIAPTAASARSRRSMARAAVFAITAAICLLSVIARAHFIESRPLAGRLDGQEPEAHVLVTDLAFNQTSASIHKFLPIFTLGARYDKFIDEHPGAASPDAHGNFFYTSTPPLTFVLPYVATLGSPSLQALRWYNVSLQLAAAMALASLACLCLRRRGLTSIPRTCLTCAVVLIYMTAPECLRSHTINLWAQQFYAVLLPLQIILFLFLPVRGLLLAVAWLGCLSDWTAYVANATMVVVALWQAWRTGNRCWLWSAVSIGLGTALGGLTMIAWFAQVMPIATYFQDLVRRSGERAGGGSSAMLLFVPRYVESFGLFLPIALGLAFLGRKDRRIVVDDAGGDRLPLAILIFAGALVENVLMKQHAIPYSYDRLKGVELLALIVCWAAAGTFRDAARALSLCAVAGVASVVLFHVGYETEGGSNALRLSQQQLIGAIIARTSSPLGPAFFSGEVRGSEVYYAGRNIVQKVGEAAADAGVDEVSYVRNWSRLHGFQRATLYDISGHYPWPEAAELPRTLKVTDVFVDGRSPIVREMTLAETWNDYHVPAASGRDLLPARPW